MRADIVAAVVAAVVLAAPGGLDTGQRKTKRGGSVANASQGLHGGRGIGAKAIGGPTTCNTLQ